MGGTEAVKEVDERNLAFNRGQMRNRGQIHNFLRVGFAQHGKTGLTAGHHVGVVTEDVQRVRGDCTGGDMEHAGELLGGDLVHVRNHEQ